MYETLKDHIKKSKDTAYKIKDNRDYSNLPEVKESGDWEDAIDKQHEELSSLLRDWVNYFNKGYVVPMTPEALQEAIIKEIDRINKG